MSTYRIYEELSETLGDKSARAVVHAIENVYEELRSTVSKSDFSELKQVVVDLGMLQQRTEKKVEELAEAQKRTEKKVEELVEAQKRTEKKVEELAEAQKRTEESVRKLSDDLRVTRREVGNLSHSIGYDLENQAYKALPELLERDFGLTVRGRLKRGYLPDRKAMGRMIEVNILGEGTTRDGANVRIVGEAKTQLSRKKVDAYVDTVAPRIETGDLAPFIVLVTHMESEPGVAEHARRRAVACYFSFDF